LNKKATDETAKRKINGEKHIFLVSLRRLVNK